ncbi:MAG TPA: hypothetical protein VGR12_05630, partial [Solirubrobacteraceae bacterium]|nr:hypothetical protein [Solirubrobacteraceae bacterium]
RDDIQADCEHVFVRRKDPERQRAREMRAGGASIRRIARELGVAKSSVSVWVRDVAVPPTMPEAPPPALPQSRAVTESGLRRTCSRCRRDLPIEAFNRLRAGHQYYCRECFREYFTRRGDVHRDQVRVTAPARRRLARKIVREVLATARCTDCGLADPIVLEFDHVGPKRQTLAALVQRAAGRRRLLEEMAQCEIVCANCHRRRTARRGAWFRITGRAAPSWSPAQLRNQQHIVDVLGASTCIDCGDSDIVILEFDHRGEKRGNVSTMASWASLDTLRAEIAKCDVRCANCHRRRTQRAIGSYRLTAIQSLSPP